jgi:anti-anti-sigma factor
MASPSWTEPDDRGRPTPFVSREGKRSVVWLAGEQDIATVSVLAETLANVTALDDADLVVDMREVSFIDSASLRALVRCGTVLQGLSRTLTLRAPSRSTQRLLALCRTAENEIAAPPALARQPAASTARSNGH